MSNTNIHPETYDQGDYTIKEITQNAQISRKIFERYKKKFPVYFDSLIKRVDENGATCYDPIIMGFAYQIQELKKQNKTVGQIDKSVIELFNLKMENNKEQIGVNPLYKPLYKSTSKRESGENKGESGENLHKEFKELYELKINIKNEEISLLKDKISFKDQMILDEKNKIKLLEAPLLEKDLEINKIKEELQSNQELLLNETKYKEIWKYLLIVSVFTLIAFLIYNNNYLKFL